MDLQTALYVVAFVLALAGSAFFAGSETALISLGRIDLQAMREKGDRRAAIIRGLRSQTARLLAVLLIGQNLFLTAASATATSLADGWIGDATEKSPRSSSPSSSRQSRCSSSPR